MTETQVSDVEKIRQLERELADLKEAAQAVVERWDTPSWKDVPYTAVYINRLRATLLGWSVPK